LKVDLSIQILSRDYRATVELSATATVFADSPCAVDGNDLTVDFEAVNTPLSRGPQAADRQFSCWAGPLRKVLDFAKNRLW
jgi:hypothetical protein